MQLWTFIFYIKIRRVFEKIDRKTALRQAIETITYQIIRENDK